MAGTAQIELWQADKVATQVAMLDAPNGIHYASWGETRVPDSDLERLVAAVPAPLAPALRQRAYYFVPLAIADTGENLVAPAYTVELGDRAVCHRNATFGDTEAVFISTRLVEDRFGLAFEFFINVAHNFVEAAGVPDSRVIELHGNTRYAKCLTCGTRVEIEDIRLHFERHGDAPDCRLCGGIVKTATISFGQAMPETEMARAEEASLAADLFLVAGSSLAVYPAAAFPLVARRAGARLVILNREKTEQDPYADLVLHREIGPTLTLAVQAL